MATDSYGRYYGGFVETIGLERDTFYGDREVPERFTSSKWRAYAMDVHYDGDERLMDLSNHAFILAEIKASGARATSYHYDGGSYLFVKVGTLADAALRECEQGLEGYPILDDEDYDRRCREYGMDVLRDEFSGYPTYLEFTEEQLDLAALFHGQMTQNWPEDIVRDGWWPSNDGDHDAFMVALAMAGVDIRPDDDATPEQEYAYVPPAQDALPGIETMYGWQVAGAPVARLDEWGQWQMVH